LGFHNRELIGCGVMNIDDESGENYQILDNERRGCGGGKIMVSVAWGGKGGLGYNEFWGVFSCN
jgi:hypothetical protein